MFCCCNTDSFLSFFCNGTILSPTFVTVLYFKVSGKCAMVLYVLCCLEIFIRGAQEWIFKVKGIVTFLTPAVQE